MSTYPRRQVLLLRAFFAKSMFYAITFTSLGHSNEFFLQSAQPFDFSAHIAELGCRNLSSCLARTIRVFLELDEGKDSFY